MAETPCSGTTNLINKDEIISLDVDIENQEEDADEEERFTNELTLTQSSIGLTIYIETLTGTTFEIQVFPSDTINDIKMKLQESQGIPVKEQHLIWKSQELRNELTIEQYGISFGMILKLVLRIRGGPIAKSPSFIFDQQDDCFNLTVSSDSSDLST